MTGLHGRLLQSVLRGGQAEGRTCVQKHFGA